jgi:hypothetical protein
MLADASISRPDVSKAKPRAARPAIGHTHDNRRPQRGVGKRRRRRRRRGIPAAGGRRRGGGPGAATEAGSGLGGGGRWGRRVREGRRVGEMRVGEGGRPAGGNGAARVSGKSGAARRRRWASGTGAARRGGGDDDGGREAIWGERISADLECDGAYIEPPTFCHRSYYHP